MSILVHTNEDMRAVVRYCSLHIFPLHTVWVSKKNELPF